MHKNSFFKFNVPSSWQTDYFCYPAKAKFFFVSFCSSQVQMTSNELTFTNVRFQEDGVYQCVVENNVDMIVSYTWVNVIGNY